MMKQLLKEAPEQEARFIRATTMKRMGEPPELHGALLFLLSDASIYVTANDFRIDGGGQTSEV
jgi:NAD(P)-dependent dehydrogenase (short-subunit alcohol dehydrogenase family)